MVCITCPKASSALGNFEHMDMEHGMAGGDQSHTAGRPGTGSNVEGNSEYKFALAFFLIVESK